MTVNRHLENAIVELVYAREAAELFQHSPEEVERIDLLKRAIAKTRSEMLQKQFGEKSKCLSIR